MEVLLLTSPPTFQAHAVSTASPGRVYVPAAARGRPDACSGGGCGLAGEAPLHLSDNDSKSALIIAIIFLTQRRAPGKEGVGEWKKINPKTKNPNKTQTHNKKQNERNSPSTVYLPRLQECGQATHLR